MVCLKCKAQNVDDAKFCESCGAKLELSKPPGSFCTSCGKPLKPGAKFCGSCGAPQTGAIASAGPSQVPQVPRPAPAPAPAPGRAGAGEVSEGIVKVYVQKVKKNAFHRNRRDRHERDR
jgi:hypothetical protein